MSGSMVRVELPAHLRTLARVNTEVKLEVAGQVTYRCEIMARPCKPPMKETAQSTK